MHADLVSCSSHQVVVGGGGGRQVAADYPTQEQLLPLSFTDGAAENRWSVGSCSLYGVKSRRSEDRRGGVE
jgi:hypothetical protein